ncbi:U3 small nucleolar ribonucleoprotein complex, subunit Mpp10 [Dactylonectria estremocensis]|uniref:U3 small nucleolar ribonucleoprotein protein MPP10 n=1 Tax=Dactylonectria estremocensis TaxID=1079267 RepID=A0A9P9F0Q3_9HYPO|nr:U3 small nucleolar ribonucleoprotein complex, subunit Mpp10 [Dactylonectria estremocensis]
MAIETSPSLTSTSHTLTATPIMAPPGSLANSHVLALLDSLREGNRHAFLQPTAAIPTDSLNLVKNMLEGFASQVGDEQQERLKENRKRKRATNADDVLKMRKVYVDGFETGQVWQQAKRIIGGVLKYSEEALSELEERDEVVMNGVDEPSSKLLEFGDDGFEVGSDDEDEESGSNESDESDGEGDDQISGDGLEEGQDDEWEDDEEVEGQVQEDDEDEDDVDEPAGEYSEDPDGLNDGFFSIDDFNKQTQWFEDQDARGDPNTDQASEDEDINWDADPLAPTNETSKASKKAADAEPASDVEDDDDDEAGPTFGDMALDAPEGDSEDEDMDEGMDDEGNDMNANGVYYKDFFAPPSKKYKGDKPKKAVRFEPKKPDETDIQRAIDDVRRDLFDDESEQEDSDDALSDVSAGDPKSRRSAHERRQAKLAEEIRKLEAASVAKREWAMSGEAAAADRPMNSLLEEDLDFEHIGKPVPVITPEVTEGIEELIKRRILAQEFDEVIRRRPDTEGLPAGTRRGLVELDDSKATKGLAELYEEEHVKNTDPDSYVSQSDEKLQREEKEVEAMWRDVSARLDSLSSWHYKPKPVAPTLSVVADVATVAMEDAQPTTAQGVAGESSRMAPQEVYKAGADTAAKGEVVSKSGLPVARQEMSREDKTARRRREKERVRKAGGVDSKKVVSRRAQMKRDTIAELKKGGVKVINRKGEITDVDGKKAKAPKAVSSGNFKL